VSPGRRHEARRAGRPARRRHRSLDRARARRDVPDPFWYERFGERANLHGKKDGRFHIDYLIQTLHAGDAAIIENYARWLQQVLTSRGMCTRHLSENFERLAAAIRDEGWRDAGVAAALLDGACAALRYPFGAAQELQRAIPRLAAAVHASLPAVELAHYATDAVALGQPAVFVAHVRWLAGFLERHGVVRAHLIAGLEAMAAAAASVAPKASDELRRVIEPALAAGS
jgi:hypothetical protein